MAVAYVANVRAILRLPVVMVALSCVSRETPQTSDTSSPVESSAARTPAVDSGAPRLEPRDDANASFREFRERLLTALARRDTAFLHSVVSQDIRTSFGADGGLKDFKSMWKTADSSSAIWATLSRVLRMGGKHSSDSMFFAPRYLLPFELQ